MFYHITSFQIGNQFYLLNTESSRSPRGKLIVVDVAEEQIMGYVLLYVCMFFWVKCLEITIVTYEIDSNNPGHV